MTRRKYKAQQMPMKIPKNNNDAIAAVKSFGDNVLTEVSPLKLMLAMTQGKMTRLQAWQILRLIHEGNMDCGLQQYGILTTFSLAKDLEEFKRLYDQGVQMLIDHDITSFEEEEQAFKMVEKELKFFLKQSKNKPDSDFPNNRLN